MPRAIYIFLIVLSVALAARSFKGSSVGATDAAKLVEEIEAAWPDWLPQSDKCPADMMPTHESSLSFSIERCSNDIEQCFTRCRTADANDCYATALVVQKIKDGDGRLSDALFLRACTLGIVSGCTNRAASLDSGSGVSCAVRTYELACDYKDPWACTMIGLHLVRGIGVEKDHDRARKAFSQSCRLGDDDQACVYAKARLKEIGDH